MKSTTSYERIGLSHLEFELLGDELRAHLSRYRYAATFVRDAVVFDAACGIGYGAKILADAGARRVSGFDLSAEAVATARDRYSSSQMQFEVHDVLTAYRGHCDVFVSFETLEHLPLDRLDDYFRHVVGAMGPGGVFICSTPDRGVRFPGRSIEMRPPNPFHQFELTRMEFEDRLRRWFGTVELHGLIRNGLFHYFARAADIVTARLGNASVVPALIERLGYYRVRPHDGSPFFDLVAVCRRPRG